MAKARAEPADEQRRVRARPLDRQPLDRSDARPAGRERCPPRERAAPGDVGDRRPGEEVRELAVCGGNRRPLRRVDDEAVADVDDLRERGRVPLRPAAPAAERGQVGDEQGQHDGRGVVRGLAAETQLDHLGQHLAPSRELEVADRRVRLDAAAAAGERHEDDRPRGVTLRETREDALRRADPLGRRPDEVGHRARAELRNAVGLLAAALPRELPLDLGDDAHVPPQCLRHERPSRCTSSSDRAGPQLPAG